MAILGAFSVQTTFCQEVSSSNSQLTFEQKVGPKEESSETGEEGRVEGGNVKKVGLRLQSQPISRPHA